MNVDEFVAALGVMDEEKKSNGGIIPLPEPQETRKAEGKKKKLWSIRPKGDVNYPVPECCHTECYDCRKAHYMFVHENSLNTNYKRLLGDEKQAMSDTIIAVEGLEKEHAGQLREVNTRLDIEKAKTLKLMKELELERKLRLGEMYTRECEANEANAIAAGNNLYGLCRVLCS